MNSNGATGWNLHRMLMAAGLTIATGLIGAGLVSIVTSFRHMDRLDERFLHLTDRDIRQTDAIIESLKRLAALEQYQHQQDNAWNRLESRVKAVEERLWRVEQEKSP